MRKMADRKVCRTLVDSSPITAILPFGQNRQRNQITTQRPDESTDEPG
jgi:hypothetical protein